MTINPYNLYMGEQYQKEIKKKLINMFLNAGICSFTESDYQNIHKKYSWLSKSDYIEIITKAQEIGEEGEC